MQTVSPTVNELRKQEIAELGRIAAEAAARWEAAKQSLQANCVHPFDSLEIAEGAVRTHNSHGLVQSLYVKCKDCSKVMHASFRIEP